MDKITIDGTSYYGIFDKIIVENNLDFVEIPDRLLVQANGSYSKPREINFEVYATDPSALNFSSVKSVTITYQGSTFTGYAYNSQVDTVQKVYIVLTTSPGPSAGYNWYAKGKMTIFYTGT
jgi:hypothetical protein